MAKLVISQTCGVREEIFHPLAPLLVQGVLASPETAMAMKSCGSFSEFLQFTCSLTYRVTRATGILCDTAKSLLLWSMSAVCRKLSIRAADTSIELWDGGSMKG